MKLVAGLTVIAAIAVAEVVMQPSTGDRWLLSGVFLGAAAATLTAAWAASRYARRFHSLRMSIVAIAVAAAATVAVVVGLSALLMFLSAHDLRLSLIALGLGAGLGLLAAGSLAKGLTDDLERLRSTAARIADGGRQVSSGVQRADEVGDLAAAIDSMARRLAAAEADRHKVETARREFLASVGHDLRTPLTSLQAAVEALQDGVAAEPDRYLTAMAADLDLMRSLVEDLFLLARIESGDLEPASERIDLTELADETVEAMSPFATSREVELRLDAESRVGVRGGSTELRRVLRNLLDNAIRYSPEQSRVTVKVTNGDSEAIVVVADGGPGFPEGFSDTAFDVFSKADEARRRSSGGAGLGLAIAKGVVEAHGGSIWIGPGPGGKVSFSLPAATQPEGSNQLTAHS